MRKAFPFHDVIMNSACFRAICYAMKPVHYLWFPSWTLTHWRMYASVNIVLIGSSNAVSPVSVPTWANVDPLCLEPKGHTSVDFKSNYDEFCSRKLIWKMLYAKWHSFFLSPDVLKYEMTVHCSKLLPTSLWLAYKQHDTSLHGNSFHITGPRLNIKTVLSTYGDFHVKDKTAVRTSYL